MTPVQTAKHGGGRLSVMDTRTFTVHYLQADAGNAAFAHANTRLRISSLDDTRGVSAKFFCSLHIFCSVLILSKKLSPTLTVICFTFPCNNNLPYMAVDRKCDSPQHGISGNDRLPDSSTPATTLFLRFASTKVLVRLTLLSSFRPLFHSHCLVLPPSFHSRFAYIRQSFSKCLPPFSDSDTYSSCI